MNLDIINQKLSALRESEKKSSKKYTKLPMLDLSKRKGKFDIRLLPNKFSPEIPFVDVYVYYGFNTKIFLSPMTFGNPDPIAQFASQVSDRELRKKFTPAYEVYAPVIVRGEESEGVKYWRFRKTTFKDLLDLLSSEDYRDLYDLEKGVDLTLEYIKETANGFPQTNVIPKRNSTPATNNPTLTNSLMESQIDVLGNFTVLSYDELETELQVFLSTNATTNTDSTSGTDYNSRFEDKQITPKDEVAAKLDTDLDNLFN
jgi:hypothetical protein